VCWRAARERTRIIHHHHTAADALEQTTWSPRFRRLLARAPELVACSKATRDNLAAALLARTRTEAGGGRARPSPPEPVFLPYFTAAPVARDAIADTPRPPGAPLHFGFIGRLVGTKGIDTLCALSLRPELADITWHIHGSGPDYPERHFARFPSIRYHGPYRDLAHYGRILQQLDAIALYTRHNEGMPLSLLEAMSAGLPWVATDRGGTRELARSSPDNTVLFSDAESEDAALAATLDLASRIRGNTTSRVAQRAVYDALYSPEVVARAWFDYFERAPDAALAKREGVVV
jgi:glycosyltransferase involved in cell wall biosynthesis